MTYPSFNSGDVLNASDMNAVGLWLVKGETAVTATNASPKGVESVFTSDYRNYRLTWYVSQATANAAFRIQWYSGTNTVETGAVYGFGWGGYYVAAGPVYTFGGYAVTNPFALDTTGVFLGADVGSGYTAHGWLDIYNPQVSNQVTRYTGQAYSGYTGTYYSTTLSGGGGTDTNTQYTGFRFIPSAGTATITYRLYGYKD